MKKILIISSMLLITLACKAQIIPVEGVKEYCKSINSGVPDGAYIKDVNGVFNKYIGTWKITYNERIYTFYITKKTTMNNKIKRDDLYAKYLITAMDGTVIEDTRNETGNSIYGYKFSDVTKSYVLGFSGDNSRCGNKGNVYISYISPTQIKFVLNYKRGLVPAEKCKDYDLSKEPIFPLSDGANFILTKQ